MGNPHGDDPIEADSLSPIRVNIIGCHDSLRDVFRVSHATLNPNNMTPTTSSIHNMPLHLKATLIIENRYVFLEAVLLSTRIALAVSMALVHGSLGFHKNHHGFSSKISCNISYTKEATSGNTLTTKPTYTHM